VTELKDTLTEYNIHTIEVVKVVGTSGTGYGVKVFRETNNLDECITMLNNSHLMDKDTHVLIRNNDLIKDELAVNPDFGQIPIECKVFFLYKDVSLFGKRYLLFCTHFQLR
jgi:hypothetical protein